KADISTRSRTHGIRVPLAVTISPARSSTGFDGECVPGIQDGYSSVISRPFTGMVSRTLKMRSLTLDASTLSVMVPAYGLSTGATMGGSSGAGCGPGGFCALARVVRDIRIVEKEIARYR